MKRILAIGAHFDDIEVACSGTLNKHIDKNDEVYLAILNSDETRTGDPEIRIQEQICASDLMKISRDRIFLFTGDILDPSDIIGELDLIKPDIIFSMFEKDSHQHHVQAAFIGRSVGRKRNLTTFFYSSGSTYDFYPTVYNIIDKERKRKIVDCFKSQLELNAINHNLIDRRESFWASEISTEPDLYAEGFIVRKLQYPF